MNIEIQQSSHKNNESQENISNDTPSEIMRTSDTLSLQDTDNLTSVSKYMENIESTPSSEKIGFLRSLGETVKKNKKAQAILTALMICSAQPAFAENGSVRLQSDNPHQINVESSDFNNPARLRMHNINQLRVPGIQSSQITSEQKNVFQRHLNHYNSNIIINGKPAREIAPGIYGDENTVYRQTSDGGTVLVGGISIE